MRERSVLLRLHFIQCLDFLLNEADVVPEFVNLAVDLGEQRAAVLGCEVEEVKVVLVGVELVPA